MPNPAADLEEALKKKGGLTLTQLANYDDLITDALVDRVYFWSTIRKLRANYHPCRGVQEEKVCDILRKEVVVHKDTSKAQDSLLGLPGLSKYHKSLRTADEKEHFVRHLRKYTNMYLPDCPFEVGTTNRYTITTAEASIIARKPIRKGEPIKYLSGIQVEMTEKEEKELCSRTDFSIVLSSRRKRPSLFLGPARFANHDCDSNAKLNTTGPHGIHIVARKDIIPGEEITVTYGLDYFGEDNCECLCATCEGLSRNGWDPRGPIINESSDDESEDDEVDDHGSQVTNDIASSQQTSTPVPSKKRKREVEELCAEPVGQTKRKRGRGRPRKRLRGCAVKSQAADSHDSSDSDDSDDSDDLRPSERKVPVYSDGIPLSERKFPVYVYTHPDDIHKLSQHSSKTTRSTNGKTEDTVNRIRQLLRNVAEREGRTGGNSESGNTSSSISRTQTPQSDIDVQLGREKSSGHTTISKVSSTRMDQTTRTMRNRDSSQISRRENTSKLPSINKERNYSRLRNVMNADDTKDPFSIPPSPQPIPESSKRGRGRAMKCTTDGEVGEQKSLSPSSVGNDSASPVSASSSATSLDIFAAGSIAENICEMFTTGIKQEVEAEDEEEEEVVAEPPRRMSTRTATRLQKEKLLKEQKETAIPNLSPGKVEKDREPLRRSIRTGQNGALSPLVRSIEKTDDPVKASEDEDSSDVERGPARTPGDYTLCKILLATPYHRWVECRNCDEFFVQSEAYLTRIACPRCERHSKLYGYYWPKTDREGKNDAEVRVTDHRTIHRFIDPEEERSERKGRRTLASVLKEKELSERLESEESDKGGDNKRLRVSPRRSESRRKLRSTM